ncbi:unnamed protein product [Adineta ricciae]|uniref:Uncharacterized protein n=1 Tax=Adineta ricciae TaxID=249248 RepID=A0A814QBV5_ADIRI|nr:unnamed protein product [Adineta ricciae]
MQVKGIVLVSIGLFVGIGALVLHLLALCSPHWKITKRDLDPVMDPVSYGLWERCEYVNMTIIKQGVALGVRPHVKICRPNHYMRYSSEKFLTCYNIRRNCPVLQKDQIPEGCSCRYLSSDRALQWLAVLAAVFIVLGLVLLYLKAIAQPLNESAVVLLSYAPVACFFLALLLMATTLILIGAFLRRDTYEDYSFPLKTVLNTSTVPMNFDLHSLQNYAKFYHTTFTRDNFKIAEKELRDDAHTHYHTVIGRATIFEIFATVLIVIVTVVTYMLASADIA